MGIWMEEIIAMENYGFEELGGMLFLNYPVLYLISWVELFLLEPPQVAPGDVVELSGIFLPIPYTGFRAMRAGLVADTYLEAMSVTHFKKKYEE